MSDGISGYGLTLLEATLGAFTGIESVKVGDLVINFDEIKTVDDVQQAVESMPLSVKEGNIDVTIKWDKTLYNALRSAEIKRDVLSFTLTDAESSTFIGDGYIETVGGPNEDTEAHVIFTCSLRPKKLWSFTPSA